MAGTARTLTDCIECGGCHRQPAQGRSHLANTQKRPNGKWRARYGDLDGTEHARHVDRRPDAQRWLDEVRTSIVTGAGLRAPEAG